MDQMGTFDPAAAVLPADRDTLITNNPLTNELHWRK